MTCETCHTPTAGLTAEAFCRRFVLYGKQVLCRNCARNLAMRGQLLEQSRRVYGDDNEVLSGEKP
jgi:ribosomal protein S14